MVEFENQVEVGVLDDAEAFERATVSGTTFEVGDLVKYALPDNDDLPCEEQSLLVGRISKIERQKLAKEQAKISFAHLAVNADFLSHVTDSSTRELWEETSTEGTNSGVVLRWHTGENPACPACQATEEPFAHLSVETPPFFKAKMDGV